MIDLLKELELEQIDFYELFEEDNLPKLDWFIAEQFARVILL